MINTKFEAYKLKRELLRSGIVFKFKRNSKNEFGEDNKEPEIIGEIKGLYHEQNSNIQTIAGDTTRSRTEKIPMILCLHEDAVKIGVKVDDYIEFNDKVFKVSGVVNVQEWNVISDISLEVIDNGN